MDRYAAVFYYSYVDRVQFETLTEHNCPVTLMFHAYSWEFSGTSREQEKVHVSIVHLYTQNSHSG